MLIIRIKTKHKNFRDFYQFDKDLRFLTTITIYIDQIFPLFDVRWRKSRNVKKAEQTHEALKWAQKSLTSNVRGNRRVIKRRFPEKQWQNKHREQREESRRSVLEERDSDYNLVELFLHTNTTPLHHYIALNTSTGGHLLCFSFHPVSRVKVIVV